jgi:hypothetical protein
VVSLETFKEFFETAKSDLSSSEILFSEKKYSEAVYHLQQAVEKAVKSYIKIIYEFDFDNSYAKKLKHNSPFVLIEPLFNINVNGIKINFVELFDNAGLDASKRIEMARKDVSDRKKHLERIKMSKEEILNLLNFDKIIFSDKKLDNLFEVINQINPDFDPIQSKIQIKLYLLAVITFSHWEASHYPTDYFSPKDYKEGLGIVDCFEEILLKTKDCFSLMEKYISKN